MSNKCPHYDDEYDYDTLFDPEFLHHPAHDWVVEMLDDAPKEYIQERKEGWKRVLQIDRRRRCTKCGATYQVSVAVNKETGMTQFSPLCKRKLIKAFE